ncbi:MAG: ABC transporter ATP-binding protein [Anaerolineae bacterium]|nr:ABC transporter ATP-binding protein [Anaerolineae bacterium]MDQ7033883.1 ABC transporter ATP-binding protein [Anaerolineae bacterium]
MGMHMMWRYVHNDLDKNKVAISRNLVLRVLDYARPYKWRIATMLGMILVTTLLGLLTPLIFRDLIDNVLTATGANAGSRDRLNMLALAMVLIPIVSGVIRVFQRRINAAVGEGVIYDLRVALYHHLQRMSLRFFTNTQTGELMSRMNNDVIGAQNAVSNTIVTILTNIFTVILTLAVMLTLEWRLTVIGVAVFPLFMWVASQLGKHLRDIAREQMQHNAQMNAMMNETLNISGALLVKLFGRTQNEVDRFDSRAVKVRDAGIKRAVLGTQFFVLISMVSVIGTALVYWVGGHFVLSGEFTVGTIVAFGTYLTQLYGPLSALTTAPVDFATSMVSFERVFEIMDLPLDIDGKADALHLDDIRGELVFDHVTFDYELDDSLLLTEVERLGRRGGNTVRAALSGDDADTKKPNREESEDSEAEPVKKSQARALALKNINFTIEPGQLVALVGPSGAGKTTMTYLIPRLYDPKEGRILLDGHDLRDLTLNTLSDHIGMVTQETYLFHDTVRTNLLYAKMDATQEELENACRGANIHDFITGLENGYDTIVGERGYRLSGGEKQRIAIARVILKNPRIIVLDEATSNLDSQSEALIQDALGRVQKGRTSIVIAHRLSTILAADRILVMDRGEIVENGTHEELLSIGGLYANLYETQFKYAQMPEPPTALAANS